MLLAEQFEQRTIEKEYFAIVVGVPRSRPGRDRSSPSARTPITARKWPSAAIIRPVATAQTFYEVIERFDGFAALKVLPKTGRTHQIRLHLSHIGCPVLCDRLYGGRSQITRGELCGGPADTEVLLDRQALHARRLKINSPRTGEPLEFIAPIPADLERVLMALRGK